MFSVLGPVDGKLSGDAARPVLMAMELEMDALFAVRESKRGVVTWGWGTGRDINCILLLVVARVPSKLMLCRCRCGSCRTTTPTGAWTPKSFASPSGSARACSKASRSPRSSCPTGCLLATGRDKTQNKDPTLPRLHARWCGECALGTPALEKHEADFNADARNEISDEIKGASELYRFFLASASCLANAKDTNIANRIPLL
jgi:hypothetical protein